jgi:hypothetical protein
MSALFKKLNLGATTTIHVLNAPPSFDAELDALAGVTVRRSVEGQSAFAMAFVITQAELDAASRTLAKACTGDAILWMVYPKKSSKRYRCEFNRDSGWSVLGSAGFEPVRMVAIDEDWSALRFRRTEFIKTLTRSADMAISETGREKAARGKPGGGKTTASASRSSRGRTGG